jgi:hypothetical protein
MSTNIQDFSGDVQIRGTTFIKANTNTNNLAIGTDAGQTSQGGPGRRHRVREAGQTSQGDKTPSLWDSGSGTDQSTSPTVPSPLGVASGSVPVRDPKVRRRRGRYAGRDQSGRRRHRRLGREAMLGTYQSVNQVRRRGERSGFRPVRETQLHRHAGNQAGKNQSGSQSPSPWVLVAGLTNQGASIHRRGVLSGCDQSGR